jgi:hypothetical protein
MIVQNRPTLSVVIAATDSPSAVLEALKALQGQAPGRVEVIVVAGWKDSGLGTRDSVMDASGQSASPLPLGEGPGVRGAASPVAFDKGGCSRRVGLALPVMRRWQGKPYPAGKATHSGHNGLCDVPHPNPLPGGEGARGFALDGRRALGPPVRRIVAPPGSSVPRLRRLGLEAALGRVVALTEDSCLAQAGWADAWLSSFDDPALVAASGSVEHDSGASALDRAVVLCEYAPFLVPVGWALPTIFNGMRWAMPTLRGVGLKSLDASPDRLAGNNFAVLREVALQCSAYEVHETALLAEIRRNGGLVRTVEAARVRHVRRFGWGEAFGDRFRFGLEFGRLRTVGASPVVRWLGLVAGPAIYLIQVARLTRTIVGNPRHLGRFVEALPITLALLAAWSLGEWLGWSLGPPKVARRDPSPARKRRGRAARSPGSAPGQAGSRPGGCKPGPPFA